MSKQFYFNQFSLAKVHNLVLIDPYIGTYQFLPLPGRVDLGAFTIKGYSTFPKTPILLEIHHQIVLCHIQDAR